MRSIMTRLPPLNRSCELHSLAMTMLACLAWAGNSQAAPQISNLSPRGLRIGGTTTVTIEGTDLVPIPRVLLPVPLSAQSVRPGATATRCQIEIKLPQTISPGLYNLWVANETGISNPVVIGIDTLEQLPFGGSVARLPA